MTYIHIHICMGKFMAFHILRKHKYRPYIHRKVQALLNLDGIRRSAFCNWYSITKFFDG